MGEDVPFTKWKAWIVAKFTWLYVGSQDLWAVFAIVLYCRLVKMAGVSHGGADIFSLIKITYN